MNAARAVLVVAVVACVGAGFAFGGPSPVWIAGAVLAAGLGLLEIRLRRRTAARRARETREPDGRDEATRVVVPWRSNPYWDGFDLEVGTVRTADWFCFYGHAGDSITIVVETSPPGPGVRVALFDADEDHPPLAESSSDALGAVTLTASTATTGIHHVRVQAANEQGSPPQRYRMSIAGPRRAAPAGPSRSPSQDFTDVPLWHPYHEAIKAVAETGLMSGRPAGADLTFGADRPVWVPDLLEIVGSSIAGVGADANGYLEGWVKHSAVGAEGMALDPNGNVPRAGALALIVGAFDHALPGVLARPAAVEVEAIAPSEEHHEAWRLIADYNGLLAGLHGYAERSDLRNPASRGEVAQLLDSTLRLVRDSSGRRPAEAAWAVSPAPDHEPTPDWDTESGSADDFIHGANEALDSLIGAYVLEEVPLEGAADIDPGELRLAVEAMRQRHQERTPDLAPASPARNAPANGSARAGGNGSGGPATDEVGAPGANGSRATDRNGAPGAPTRNTPGDDPLRTLRRRNGHGPTRFKARGR